MSYYANSNGVKIHYQIRGEGAPLVLIMGFGADGNVWEKHLQVYEKHFKCIVIDNRGVGLSSQPKGPYSTAMMADDTAAVMDDAGVAKACIAGISMGGTIAQELALRHPDKVEKLVLACTWPSFNDYAKAVYKNLKKLRITSKPEDFMALIQLWIFAPPYFKENSKDLKEGREGAANNPNPQSQDGFEGQLEACINHNTEDRLQNIKVPTMITVGEMDIFTPPEFSDILAENIKGAVYAKYPNAGHAHHWEDLERFNRETLAFLKAP